MEECKLYGMKNHDCHVFMQRLIPLAYRDLLSKGIRDALTEINHFFRDICSSKLNVDDIERLETNIVETLRKLEMYSLHHFLTQWSISPYIYNSRQKLEDWSSIDGCTHSNG
jgi:transposase